MKVQELDLVLDECNISFSSKGGNFKGVVINPAYKDVIREYAYKKGLFADELAEELSQYNTQRLIMVFINKAQEYLNSGVLSFYQFQKVLLDNEYSVSKTLYNPNYEPLSRANLQRPLYEFLVKLALENKIEMSEAVVSQIINGAKLQGQLTKEEAVNFAEVIKIIQQNNTEKDIQLFKSLNAIQKIFSRRTNNKNKQLNKVILDSYKKAQEVAKLDSNDVENFSATSLNMLKALACLYDSISRHLPNVNMDEQNKKDYLRFVDALMIEEVNSTENSIMKRLIKFNPEFNKTQVELFDEFLDELVRRGSASSDEVFTEQEVANLLKHTTSLIFFTDKQKLTGARDALNKYINYVSDIAKISNQLPVLDGFSTKTIFLKAGTILKKETQDIENAVQFLMGKPIKEIIKPHVNNNLTLREERENLLLTILPDLKIDEMELNTHLRVLKERPSILKFINTENLLKITTTLLNSTTYALDISDVDDGLYVKNAKLHKLGFDVNQVISADNLFAIFADSNLVGNTANLEIAAKIYTENVKILSKIISVKDIFAVAKHNIGILLQDNKNDLSNIIAQSSTAEELRANITNFLNSNPRQKPTNNSRSTTKRTQTNKTFNRREKIAIPPKQSIDIDGLSLDADGLKELGFDISITSENAAKIDATVKINKKEADKAKQLETKIAQLENEPIAEEQMGEQFQPESEQAEQKVTDLFVIWEKLFNELNSVDDYTIQPDKVLPHDSIMSKIAQIIDFRQKVEINMPDGTTQTKEEIEQAMEEDLSIISIYDNEVLQEIEELKSILHDVLLNSDSKSIVPTIKRALKTSIANLKSLINKNNEEIKVNSTEIKQAEVDISAKSKDTKPALINEMIKRFKEIEKLNEQNPNNEDKQFFASETEKLKKHLDKKLEIALKNEQELNENKNLKKLYKFNSDNLQSINKLLTSFKKSLEDIANELENLIAQEKSKQDTQTEEKHKSLEKLKAELEYYTKLAGRANRAIERSADYNYRPESNVSRNAQKYNEKIEQLKSEIAELEAELDIPGTNTNSDVE